MRGLGSFDNRSNLVALQFFGTIIVMTVLIMEPVSLELNKILTSHNSATDLAQTPMGHRTAIYVILGLEQPLLLRLRETHRCNTDVHLIRKRAR